MSRRAMILTGLRENRDEISVECRSLARVISQNRAVCLPHRCYSMATAELAIHLAIERRERIGLQEAPFLGTVVTFNKNFAPASLHIVFSQTTSVVPSTK